MTRDEQAGTVYPLLSFPVRSPPNRFSLILSSSFKNVLGNLFL